MLSKAYFKRLAWPLAKVIRDLVLLWGMRFVLLCASSYLMAVLIVALPLFKLLAKGVCDDVLDAFPIQFDSAIWKTAHLKEQFDHSRLRMVADLTGKHPLVGMTRDEVIGLLGEPTYSNVGYASYCLGPEHGFIRIDDEWLWIEFDAADRVTSFHVRPD